MKKYDKSVDNDKIVFRDLTNNLELSVMHYEEECAYDTPFIDERYDIDFLKYVIEDLKESKDIGILFVEYDSKTLEEELSKLGLKVSYYQYTIKPSKNAKSEGYEIADSLDPVAKEFYLSTINRIGRENFKMTHPNEEYREYGEKWLYIEGFKHRVYRKNGKVVGVVDYQNFEYDPDYGTPTNKYFDCNNKLCIRCFFSEDDKVFEDIIDDLLAIYKKDIIVSITYNEKNLKRVVDSLNSEFDFCQYTLADNN